MGSTLVITITVLYAVSSPMGSICRMRPNSIESRSGPSVPPVHKCTPLVSRGVETRGGILARDRTDEQCCSRCGSVNCTNLPPVMRTPSLSRAAGTRARLHAVRRRRGPMFFFCIPISRPGWRSGRVAKAGRRPAYFFNRSLDKRGGEMAAEARRSDQGGEMIIGILKSAKKKKHWEQKLKTGNNKNSGPKTL